MTLMRDLINLVESAGAVRITDLYSPDELNDERETIHHFVDPDDADAVFAVHTMPAEQVKGLLTAQGDMTVEQAFGELAEPASKRIVQRKVKKFDANRIVVLKGSRVIDGNHHVMAAILTHHPINYIDLNQHWDWE